MSEIEDIFASKGKTKPVFQQATSSSLSSSRKRRKKRTPTAVTTPTDTLTEKSKKRPLPDTIVDKSDDVPSILKRRRKEVPKPRCPENNLSNFNDSRGNSDRKRTEEGWLVYKEDELGITEQGGNTPLCPFDCECCF